MSAWAPIESAPRNGQLLYVRFREGLFNAKGDAGIKRPDQMFQLIDEVRETDLVRHFCGKASEVYSFMARYGDLHPSPNALFKASRRDKALGRSKVAV